MTIFLINQKYLMFYTTNIFDYHADNMELTS